jgi:hypothetical protein
MKHLNQLNQLVFLLNNIEYFFTNSIIRFIKIYFLYLYSNRKNGKNKTRTN